MRVMGGLVGSTPACHGKLYLGSNTDIPQKS
jgi:hypothetical protein